MDDIIKLKTRCVSHEIRNHLSICEMYAEIIKKNTEKDNYTNSSVMNAISCIKKSLRIIGTSLIDLKSINNTELKTYDFKEIVLSGINLSSAYITNDKEIKLNYFIKNTANIAIDENKFLACIVNIIKNAIEAIETNGEIQIIAEVKSDNYAHLRIANNGKMISKEKQKEIFNEGYTTKASGSGLGLHICKKNLQEQNAILKLNKSTKKITEFEITIPTIQQFSTNELFY